MVIRSGSFAAEALSDLGATGGSAAYLLGASPLAGFLAAALAGAMAIDLLGSRRSTSRDLATGIVLGGGLGLAALFLDLDTQSSSTSGASIAVLFGSLFVISSSTEVASLVLGALALVLLGLVARRLLLATLSPDIAAARQVHVRLVGVAYLAVLALAVALAALTIGAVLGLALLVGPAATAIRLTSRPARAVLLAAGLGVLSTWLGVVLAWDSYEWPPVGNGWPVSFFIVVLIVFAYLLSFAVRPRRRKPAQPAPGHVA
jgi:zinc/manganese transport system permease protein